jgi:hypothetical protein
LDTGVQGWESVLSLPSETFRRLQERTDPNDGSVLWSRRPGFETPVYPTFELLKQSVEI